MNFLAVLCLASTTLARPQGIIEDLNDLGQNEDVVQPLMKVRDQVVQGWEWLQEFLPGQVSTYVEETAVDGQSVLEDIYAETRDSLVGKTSANVDAITGLVEGFIKKLTNIKDAAVNIVTQEDILSAQQIEARNVEEGLEGTKLKLKALKQEISVEKQEDQAFEGVEGMIQRLITSAREVLSEVNGHTDVFWSKVKQLEVEVYNVNSIMAETSGDMKDVLNELFSTLNKELREASPALKDILNSIGLEATK